LSQPLYFDYAATTPLDPRVAADMASWLGGGLFGNAGASHAYGVQARAATEQARAAVAALIGATPREIVFTSGATESDNLAILGLVRGLSAERGGKPVHLVSARIEHKAVLDPVRQLVREGHSVTWLDPDSDGVVAVDTVLAALRPDTVLVSLMHANNEIGVIQNVAAVGQLCRSRGVALHVDAAQSVGKIPVDVERLQVDLLSISAHKFYGPQGCGALYVRAPWRARLQPLQFGGGQERALRSGTLPVHQIVGMGTAARIAADEQQGEAERLLAQRERLWAGIAASGGVVLNGAGAARLPGILNLSFAGVHGEALLSGLRELALSTSAACNADSDETSYVLRAIGRDPLLAQATLRFSLGRFTTDAEIETAIQVVGRELSRLRELADLDGLEAGEGSIGEAGDTAAGTRIRWRLRCEGGRIVQAAYRAFAAGPVLDVCDWLAAVLPGRSLADDLPDEPHAWAQRCAVPPEQLGRLLIVEDALLAARAAALANAGQTPVKPGAFR
jgi:cysteine desulfurase